MNAFTAALEAIAAVFGWARDRSKEHNTPDIKDRIERQREQDRQAEVNQAIAKRDEQKIREELSE